MAKFKVGDKVRVTKCLHGHGFNINEVVEITHHNVVDQDYECYNGLDGWFLCETEFELYEERETEMTAEQIRNEILRINSRIEEAKKDIENAEKERSSLVEKLRKKGFEIVNPQPVLKDIISLDEVVVGETYIVTNNFGEADDYFVGKKVIVEEIDATAYSLFIYAKTECGEYGDWMHYQDLAKI